MNKHLLISAQRLCEAADCGGDRELSAGCDFHISVLQPPAPNKHNSPMDKRLIINFQKGRERGGGEKRERAVPRLECCALCPGHSIPEHPWGGASTPGVHGDTG